MGYIKLEDLNLKIDNCAIQIKQLKSVPNIIQLITAEWRQINKVLGAERSLKCRSSAHALLYDEKINHESLHRLLSASHFVDQFVILLILKMVVEHELNPTPSTAIFSQHDDKTELFVQNMKNSTELLIYIERSMDELMQNCWADIVAELKVDSLQNVSSLMVDDDLKNYFAPVNTKTNMYDQLIFELLASDRSAASMLAIVKKHEKKLAASSQSMNLDQNELLLCVIQDLVKSLNTKDWASNDTISVSERFQVIEKLNHFVAMIKGVSVIMHDLTRSISLNKSIAVDALIHEFSAMSNLKAYKVTSLLSLFKKLRIKEDRVKINLLNRIDSLLMELGDSYFIEIDNREQLHLRIREAAELMVATEKSFELHIKDRL